MAREHGDHLPHVADGLTRVERVVLWVLYQARAEFGDRHVPTATLYGRVVEHVNLSPAEFQAVLARLIGAGFGPAAERPAPGAFSERSAACALPGPLRPPRRRS